MSELVAIYVTSDAGGPMRSVATVDAVAGRGLVGDRNEGDNRDDPERQLTLIEAEAVEAVASEQGLAVTAGDMRRNLVVRGVSLNDLVGREFAVGPIRVRGIKLCEPCRHLERLTGLPVIKPFVHRAGLNAEILTSGRIAVGDAVGVDSDVA
ncbi:MAG: MOSC domain-containing protein [Nitriliruptorales bacterium]